MKKPLLEWLFYFSKFIKYIIFTLIEKEQCEILHTRFEVINIPILLMSIFNFNNKKLREKYMRKIAFYDPGNAKFKEIMSNMNVLLSIK